MKSWRKAKINKGKHIHIMSLLTLLYRHPSEIQTDPLGSLNHLLCMFVIFSNIYVMLNLYRAFLFSFMPSLTLTWKFTYTKLQNDMNFYGCSCSFIHRHTYIKYLYFLAKLSYKNVVSSVLFFYISGVVRAKKLENEGTAGSDILTVFLFQTHSHVDPLNLLCTSLSSGCGFVSQPHVSLFVLLTVFCS